MQQYDVVVIGAGPGGYVAAIRAAQLGAKVAVVEKQWTGGTCLNVGCIPTKAFVHTAAMFRQATESAKFGVGVGDPQLDWSAAVKHKEGVVTQMTRGVAGLLKANGVEFIQATARFTGSNTIDADGTAIQFGKAIVATGSAPTRPPIPGIEDERCIDSTGMLAVQEVPKRLLVLGGGVIGVEFASIFDTLGSEVTIVEMLPRLCAAEDKDATDVLEKEFEGRGIAMHLGARVEKLEAAASGVTAHFSGESGAGSVEADLVLVATGRAPVVDGLGLEEAGISFDPRSGITVDEHQRTSNADVFAIGDVAGRWQLAHTASREGEVAAENAMGHTAVVDGRAVPRVIYTDPEIAAVGLTEQQAREQHGDDLYVGTFPFLANSRATIYGDRTGFVKVIAEKTYGELLGVIMVGSHVSDLIGAGVNAIEAESTIETVAFSIQAHPTLSEALKEAALDAMGQVVHMPPRKKPVAAGV